MLYISVPRTLWAYLLVITFFLGFILGLIGFSVAISAFAQAEPRTLEELIADENANVMEVVRAKNRRADLEEECDCVIQHGVKIHGYPGAWSARNRKRRDQAIDLYIEGEAGTPSVNVTPR